MGWGECLGALEILLEVCRNVQSGGAFVGRNLQEFGVFGERKNTTLGYKGCVKEKYKGEPKLTLALLNY